MFLSALRAVGGLSPLPHIRCMNSDGLGIFPPTIAEPSCLQAPIFYGKPDGRGR